VPLARISSYIALFLRFCKLKTQGRCISLHFDFLQGYFFYSRSIQGGRLAWSHRLLPIMVGLYTQLPKQAFIGVSVINNPWATMFLTILHQPGGITPAIIQEEIYPVFLLNTRTEDQSCVFLRDSRCSVYDGRPRVCRLYPFTVENGQRGRRFAYYQCIDQHAAHFKGERVSVEKWMYQNFTRDAREFIEAENTSLRELGKLLLGFDTEDRKRFMFQLLYYRYYNYDLDQPFQPQYETNQRLLLEALRQEL
jgi:Fe-S-cluster containining protein